MNNTFFLLILLLFLFLYLLKTTNILEHAIAFEPPYLSNDKEKDTIGELMRIGTQSNANAEYDTVDTNLLSKPK